MTIFGRISRGRFGIFSLVGVLNLGVGLTQAAVLPSGFSETLISEALNPTTMTFSPDGRLFLCEKQGLLRVIVDGRMLDEASLDLRSKVDRWNERGLLSVCFDPGFEENGWLYVFYTYNQNPIDESHRSSNNRISRFTLLGNRVDPMSEQVILEIDQLSKTGWHNGGGLTFGADEKLYISTGENANGAYAQSGENMLGKLLRINRDGSIPTDNPYYFEYEGNNRAIVAMGLRNPYAIARQKSSGLLYLSVTGAQFEQVVRYESSSKPKAVNYGWPNADGPLHKEALPRDYSSPDYMYDHGEGRGLALCGGDFYEPSKAGAEAFPSAYSGRFFFTDYGGWIASIDPAAPAVRNDFATGINRPIDVAIAPDGALWYIERAGIQGGSDEANSASEDGRLWRVYWTGSSDSSDALVEKSSAGDLPSGLPYLGSGELPATVLATGVFVDSDLKPTESFLPYSLNSPAWADGADVQHWLALPQSGKVVLTESGALEWPGGTVFVQHFDIVTDKQEGKRRKIETRLLVLDSTGEFGYGATYRWRHDGSDADLVDAAGEEELLEIVGESGALQNQKWTYPSRGLCYMCHTPQSGFVLGAKAHQLNRVHAYSEGDARNQLNAWSRLGIFAEELKEGVIDELPRSCRVDDLAAPLEERVKSYLDVNCASCHRPGGSGALWDARFEIPLEEQGILGGDVRNTFGIEGGKIVTPGDVGKSLLHSRLASTSIVEQMPPLTRNVVDEEALEIIREWILAVGHENK